MRNECITFDADPSLRGRSLAEALAARGVPLNMRCGGRGLCRGCELDLRAGSVEVQGRLVAAPATVPACQARLAGPATVDLPARARLLHRPFVGEAFEICVPYGHDPLFAPAGERDTAFAVDAGTTTVVLLLVDLVAGEVLARTSAFNAQLRFGDNVIARIDAARDPSRLGPMRRAIVAETIAPLLARACAAAGRSASRIAGGTVAGNMTMLHLLAGQDPSPMGAAPFTPRFLSGQRLDARGIGLSLDRLAPDTPLRFLPGLAAYIGADIAAGIAATGMAYAAAPAMLVDIGTNGEIVLQHDGRLVACAAAAGPAFEGCGLSGGSRAHEGAVSAVRLGLDPFRCDVETIGAVAPADAVGLCGSAYIDFMAQARACGLLNQCGRFEDAAWRRIPGPFRVNHAGRALRLPGTRLTISEQDVALLMQAKGAIAAGIDILLETAGIRAPDIDRVWLAGGFGMNLNAAHAAAIGLLPGFRPDQVHVAGNTALAGALLALLDRSALDDMEQIRGRMEVIDLNLAQHFEERYIERLMIP